MWPRITQLRLGILCELTSYSMSVLTHGQWHGMQDLDLSLQPLSEDIFEVLGQAQWPELQHLNLTATGLEEQGMRGLIKGNWPTLRRLAVAHNHAPLEGHSFDCAAIGLMTAGNWPKLEKLNVHGNHVNAEGMSLLMAGNWPLLKALDVVCIGVDVAAMQVLLTKGCCFPLLECLGLPEHTVEQVDTIIDARPEDGSLLMSAGNCADRLSAQGRTCWPCLKGLYFDEVDNSVETCGDGPWVHTWDLDLMFLRVD